MVETKVLRCCDVGILLTPQHREFEFYNQVYDNKYGYYDENQIAFKEEDTQEAIDYAKEYVTKGQNMTYAIVTNQGECYCEEPFDNGEVENFTYKVEDIIYSIAKINNEIIENFIKVT